MAKETEEKPRLVIQVEDPSQLPDGSNPLNANPNNIVPGGQFIVGNKVVDANGNVIGDVEFTAPVPVEQQRVVYVIPGTEVMQTTVVGDSLEGGKTIVPAADKVGVPLSTGLPTGPLAPAAGTVPPAPAAPTTGTSAPAKGDGK